MLNVQTYLLTHSLGELASDHGVYARFSTKNPNKFTLNYDQLEARDNDPISQECRGLVLRAENPLGNPQTAPVGETRVMAFPMRRFFNYGQGAAAEVDFSDPRCRFLSKEDGTLCIMYWDRDIMSWCVGTRSVPDADLPMDGFGEQTFADLFWKAFKASGGDLSSLGYAKGNYTFCFELCTPDNQIVVKYPDYKVFLLAVRGLELGFSEDMPDVWAEQIRVPVVPSYRFGSTEEMLDFVQKLNGTQNEGIVVCDTKFNRVKVKNAGYLALSKVKDSVTKSPRSIMEVILHGQEDDVLPLCSQHVQDFILNTKEGLRKALLALDEEFSREYVSDRKAFALAIQAGSGEMGPQMARWSGKCGSAREWINVNKKEGGWPASFLDKLLSMAKNVLS